MGSVTIRIPDITHNMFHSGFVMDIPSNRTPMGCFMTLLIHMNSPLTVEDIHRLLAHYKVYYFKNINAEIIQSIDCEDMHVENGSTAGRCITAPE